LEEGAVLGLPFCKKANGMARIAIPFDDLKHWGVRNKHLSVQRLK